MLSSPPEALFADRQAVPRGYFFNAAKLYLGQFIKIKGVEKGRLGI